MNRALGARTISVVLALVTLGYIVIIGRQAIALLDIGDPVATAIGIALLLLPALGAWAVVRETVFGVRAEALARRLESEHALPDSEVPVRPSGRVDRVAAEALFDRYAAETESSPDDWRAWFRLGLVYDGAGDRRRARAAVRRAIELERADR